MAEKPTVLVVDDELRSLETIRRILREDYQIETAESAEAAFRILEREWVQVILSDQRMPGMTGVEFLKEVRERWPDVVRIIISGYTDPEDIIAAVNDAGIYEYITKPWHPEQLGLTLRNACELFKLQRDNCQLSLEMKVSRSSLEAKTAERRETLKKNFRQDSIVRTVDSPLNAICEQLFQVAPFDVPVLIQGESGTGKELIARALHYNSLRADKAFVAENCAAIPDNLLESELFGHKRGAFTGAERDHVGLFEQADGGTVFLDEIGEISPTFQVKLLRVLQEGEIRPVGSTRRKPINVRVVAATNKDLEAEVRAGNFREDLFYRLSTIQVGVPALRDRPTDIPVLAQALLDDAMSSHGKFVDGFSDEAIDCMQSYHWPGNVRELQNEVLAMLVMAREGTLGADLLSPRVLRGAPTDAAPDPMALPLSGSLKERVEAMEASILKETLIRHRWNKTRAADELGLSRVGLRNKLERYGLEKVETLSTGDEDDVLGNTGTNR